MATIENLNREYEQLNTYKGKGCEDIIVIAK